jgi:flagellar biosynthesis protein FliQ
MNGQRIFDLWHSGLVTAAWVAAPFLIVALGVGFITSLLQAATQLQ